MLIAWLVNYPGRLESDSYDMLTQAHAGVLNDWHAPAVTWLWSVFTPVLGQPAGALLIQALFIFAYPALVFRKLASGRPVRMTAALMILWGVFVTALIAVTGWIMKDLVLVGLVLCSLAALDMHMLSSRGSRAWLVALIPLIVLALLVRPSNFLFVALAGVLVSLRLLTGRPRLMAGALVVALSLLSIAGTAFMNRVAFGASDARAERQLVIFDVAGISTHIRHDLFVELPDWPRDSVLRPWECYTPTKWDPFAWGKCSRYEALVDERMQRPGSGSLVRWWAGIVLRHPAAYLTHRLSYAYALLSRMEEIPFFSAANTRGAEGPGGSDMPQIFQAWTSRSTYRPFGRAGALVFARPFVVASLFVCFATLLWLWALPHKSKDLDVVSLTAAAIGVANFMMYIPFGVGDEVRYLLPTMVCGVVCLERAVAALR